MSPRFQVTFNSFYMTFTWMLVGFDTSFLFGFTGFHMHLHGFDWMLHRMSSLRPFKEGWDSFTLLAVFADLSNAVSSALVFRKLSAVAKYVCRASSAVPMYIFYWAVGRAIWDLKVFGVVLLLGADHRMRGGCCRDGMI